MMSRAAPLLLLSLALAACAEAERQDPRVERDPQVTAALADPLMADPDLVSQSRGDSALQGGGPPSAEIPPDKKGPEEVARASAEALALAGGRLARLPAAGTGLARSRLAGQLTPQAIAAALPELSQGCAGKPAYGFIWAARLPAALPVYPRGHARQAAGLDAPGCRLRVVDYLTPVEPAAVLAFHATLAGKAGLAQAFRQEGEDIVLTGKAPGLAFAVYVRQFEPGMSQIILITRER
jgi:hypothetical protein